MHTEHNNTPTGNAKNLDYRIGIVNPNDKQDVILLASKVFNAKEINGLNIQLSQYLKTFPEQTLGLPPEVLIEKGIMISQEWYSAKSLQGEFMGFTGIETHNYEGDYDIAWLNWTAIDPKFQGNGVGKALFHHALDNVKKYNLHKFFVQTNPNYVVARKMYEKLGFKQVALLPNYSGDNNDVIVYNYVNGGGLK